jgi:hypothetical protein
MLTDKTLVLNLGFLAAWALLGAVGAMSAAVAGPDPPPPPPTTTFWIEELSDDDD